MQPRKLLTIVLTIVFGLALVVDTQSHRHDGDRAALASPNISQISNDDWFIYLFDDISSELIRIDQNGDWTVFPLGLGEGEIADHVDLGMVISHDGTTVAFCKALRRRADPYQYVKTLVLRDIAVGANTLEVPLGPVPVCTVSAFGPDGQQVAVGLATAMPSYLQDPPIDPDVPVWRLQLVDTSTGEVADEVNSLTAGMPPFGTLEPLLVRVTYWDAETVSFVGMRFQPHAGGIDRPPTAPAYRWSLHTGGVDLVDEHYSLCGDVLSQTGERVYPTVDDRLPAAVPAGPRPQANVLNVVDGEGTRLIYHNAEWVILDAKFVNDGRAVVAQLESEGSVRYVLVDRAGGVTALPAEYDYVAWFAPAPVPGGAVFLWMEPPTAEQPGWTARLGVVKGAAVREIWAVSGPDFISLRLVWSPPVKVEGTLVPFSVAE